MKRTSTVLALLALAWGVSAQSATSTTKIEEKTMNIRVNPLAIVFGVINADADFRVGEKMTIGPSLSFATSSAGTIKATGFGASARMNYYLTGDAISDSWYVSPDVGLLFLSVSDGGANSGSATAFVGGATAGYHWVWGSGFNLMLGFGAGFYTAPKTVVASSGTSLATPSFTGVLPRLDLGIGYAF